MVVITAYILNEVFVNAYLESQNSNERTGRGGVLIGGTVVLTVGSLVWLVFQFIWFSDCGANVFYLILTVIFVVVFYVLVLLRTREDASIFTSSIVTSYIVYLSWAALASNPDAECNPMLGTNKNTAAQITVGFFFTFLTLFVTSALSKDDTSASNEKGVAGAAKNVMAEDEEKLNENVDIKGADGQQIDSKEHNIYPVTTATIYFHIVMCLAACYYAMLFTNWGDPVFENDTNDYFEENKTSFWIKLVIQWLSAGLYIATLLAPICCPNRFG